MLNNKNSDAFICVVETGSFESAAERLCITSSAVTLRVQALEKDLGHILLIRERPCRTTAAGEKLYAHLKQTQLLEHCLLQELAGQGVEHSFNTLHIATNADTLATWLLPSLQSILITEKVALKLQVADQTMTHQLLESGRVSACISTMSVAMKGCDIQQLGAMSYKLVATPTFFQTWFKNGLTRDALRQAPAVIFNEFDHMHHDVIAKHFGLNMTQYPHHFIPSSHAFFDAILLGLGFGMVPEFQIGEKIKLGELIDVLPIAKTEVQLYWHHWQKQSIPLQKISQSLLQMMPDALNHPS